MLFREENDVIFTLSVTKNRPKKKSKLKKIML